MQHKKQKQDKSELSQNIVKYFKEHPFLNGYLYYELIGAITTQNDTNIESILTKLAITTICQLVIKCCKSPKRNDDENTRKD